MLPDEPADTRSGFLRPALDQYCGLGLRIDEVMTDSGPACHSRDFAALWASAVLRHIWTRPYRSQTNGKAERFIQTLLRE